MPTGLESEGLSVKQRQQSGSGTSSNTAASTGSSADLQPYGNAAAAEAIYKVQSGDTLSGIAGLFTGDVGRYPEIYDFNRDLISDPNLIDVGWELDIPHNWAAEEAPTTMDGTEAPPLASEDEAYKDQRDNQINGEGACNVTTVTMQLCTMASESEVKADAIEMIGTTSGYTAEQLNGMQVEDVINILCQIKGINPASGPGMEATLDLFTDIVANTEQIDYDGTDAKTFFETHCKPTLDAGGTVTLGVRFTGDGHIMMLTECGSSGINYHDPYGCWLDTGKYVRNNDLVYEGYSCKKAALEPNLTQRLASNDDARHQILSGADEIERAEELGHPIDSITTQLSGDIGKDNFLPYEEIAAQLYWVIPTGAKN